MRVCDKKVFEMNGFPPTIGNSGIFFYVSTYEGRTRFVVTTDTGFPMSAEKVKDMLLANI